MGGSQEPLTSSCTRNFANLHIFASDVHPQILSHLDCSPVSGMF
jgi:hypothetical protein